LHRGYAIGALCEETTATSDGSGYESLDVVVVAQADGVLGLVEDRLVRLVRAADLVAELLRVRLGRVGLESGGSLVEVLLGLLANTLLRVGLKSRRGLQCEKTEESKKER
jgi:hypothetical protein